MQNLHFEALSQNVSNIQGSVHKKTRFAPTQHYIVVIWRLFMWRMRDTKITTKPMQIIRNSINNTTGTKTFMCEHVRSWRLSLYRAPPRSRGRGRPRPPRHLSKIFVVRSVFLLQLVDSRRPYFFVRVVFSCNLSSLGVVFNLSCFLLQL